MEQQENNNSTENTNDNRTPAASRDTRPQQNQQFRSQRPSYPRKGNFYFRKKVCKICTRDFMGEVDYKNVYFLKRFITEKGKILPKRLSGLCAKHHRLMTKTIKQARTIALLSFTERL